MGLGDDIMATAVAKIEKEKYPDKQIIIGNFEKRLLVESIIYKNNPHITTSEELDNNKPVHFVNNHNENRPYIDWQKTNLKNYKWNFNFKSTPGQIFFSKEEVNFAKKILTEAQENWHKKKNKSYNKIIFIEPTSTKIRDQELYFKHRNKDWGLKNWQKLSDILQEEHLVIQSVHNEGIELNNIFTCQVDFRIACALISKSNIFIGPEGGLGHASAALAKPAVIIFGGWIHPSITGYDFHENIYIDIKGSPCGAVGYECKHCKECMKNITLDQVIFSINKILKNK